MGVGGQHHAPAALPLGKTQYPLYRRLGGPQGRSGRVRKISPPPGFDPRTAQPVASRYTDYAFPAAVNLNLNLMLHVKNYIDAHKIHYWSTHIFLCNLIILLHVLTVNDHLQGKNFRCPWGWLKYIKTNVFTGVVYFMIIDWVACLCHDSI